jgi:hypothetical protein
MTFHHSIAAALSNGTKKQTDTGMKYPIKADRLPFAVAAPFAFATEEMLCR